jgi:UV DNA damage endonuclease
LRELIAANVEGLQTILRFNEERGYRLFRIGNDFIPFGSHPINEIPWWEELADEFRQIGGWVREHGHRLSFHASHYTILNSANAEVAAKAREDVIYMGRVLEAMELGADHKVILHGGINTPSPAEAEARLEQALEPLAQRHRRHLVLENDERFYSSQQMISLGGRLGLPVVVDTLHHACNPGEWSEMPVAELLERVFSTWKADDGPPKMHFSSQDPEKRTGAHGYWIDPGELERFLVDTRAVSRDFDIMFEAKGKDLAVNAVLPVLRQDPRFEAGETARLAA